MKRAIVMGISGGTCAGKSSFARALIEKLGIREAAVLSQDAYYKGLEPSSQGPHPLHHNFDHPDAFDSELLIAHAEALAHGEGVRQPVYDYHRHVRTGEWRVIKPSSFLILEGLLIFHYEPLRKLCDVKIYVDAPADVRLIRRLRRDVLERGRSYESVLRQYEETVRPMHEKFVEPTTAYADLVVSNDTPLDEVLGFFMRLAPSLFGKELGTLEELSRRLG